MACVLRIACQHLTAACLWMFLVACASAQQSANSSKASLARRVMITDSITMRRVGEPWDKLLGRSVEVRSPNGRLFVIVTHRGNILDNTNDYSLLLFRADTIFTSQSPEVLITIASASNRPGISELRWVDDETLLFLSAAGHHPQQVVSLNVRTKLLIPISHHPTDVMGFDATTDATSIVYVARPLPTSYWTEETERNGLVISEQYLGNILAGHEWQADEAGNATQFEVFFQRRDARSVLMDVRKMRPHPSGLSIAPDGRRVILRAWIDRSKIPPSWTIYRDALAPDSMISVYLLVDSATRSSRVLLNAPVAEYGRRNVVWLSTDTVLMTDAYLPPEKATTPNPEQLFTIELNVETGEMKEVARGPYNLLAWDESKKLLHLESREFGERTSGQEATRKVAYAKREGRWQRITDTSGINQLGKLEVFIAEDLNNAPKLVVRDRRSRRERVVLDLNPQFRDLRFGKVEEIVWTTTAGDEIRGGLYLPPDYVPGRRYPVVIQTHGWLQNAFSIDGLCSAGYAAQALAARDIIVVQAPDLQRWEGTSEEGARYMAMHEAAIAYLDQRGMIDTQRIGIFGWSRTGFHVRYTVTFSRYQFAAAVIADGMDASYGAYLSYLNLGKGMVGVYEAINGGPPFGDNLQNWVDRATGFNLHRVRTPIRLLAFIPSVLLNNWEWFTILKYQGKPVEMILFRDAAHVPVRPAERLIAQQGNVDWFDFWLNGVEDGDAGKFEQYSRWRELRELSESPVTSSDARSANQVRH